MPVDSLQTLFENFNNLRVLIIGDVMVDAYVWGRSTRLSPEAPVPIVHVARTEQRLGGAANVALNVQALGATPLLCAVIGTDAGGDQLLQLLQERQLSSAGIIRSAHRPTTVKQRILAHGQQLLRIDSEIETDINAEERTQLLAAYDDLLTRADVVIFEDYDKGVLNEAIIAECIARARQRGIPTVVDPKKKNFLAYRYCTLFKPNLKELREGLKLEFGDPNSDRPGFEAAVTRLHEVLEPETVLVTLSEYGVFAQQNGTKTYLPAHLRTISDVSGAGDTVISIAALCVALGQSAAFTAALANLGGGLVCEQVGVVPVEKLLLLQEAQEAGLK
ncbi:D-glycero-beta-D-manno-heptose-7-phosphate kinase [Hymenobacter sp. BT683]|uniref:D-glycero-beta-D-manno-heptose-7-phosphate kinase n=1 Tax=Hymenobacter jeongseonensis TaxID=2791027 RepID=A0ABS0II14_9BACT|nr:bifunctional ADP-heptose synthase [Hymenobacter jeongseonensis]MBF9237822.1 D-glycero-beta-D-manno-heptose-7-phosphate kinase [Hymenobacter jeongseonensis]